ncbi:hypothetical protein KIPB_007090, partial [Kipferlia bialata]|eukprot:g7090.t1
MPRRRGKDSGQQQSIRNLSSEERFCLIFLREHLM